MEEIILQKLQSIEKLLAEQNLLQKDVLNLQEASTYTGLSTSNIYKLTSTNQIPFYCPQGKKIYFNRKELDQWLQQNRNVTTGELDNEANDYLLRSGFKRVSNKNG